MSVDLKFCPFCGATGDVEVHKTSEIEEYPTLYEITKGWIVMCGYCCNRTMLWDYKKDAIKAWNTRHEPKEKL